MDNVRIGYISSHNEVSKTYRVKFADKKDMVSGELKVLNNGGGFEVNQQVLCLYTEKGDGFILGVI